MSKPVDLFRGTSGLNNAVAPSRLGPTKEGQTPLSAAYNVDIDPSGRVQSREGFTQHSATATHLLWRDGGEAFCVQGTSLKRLDSDLSLSTVATVTAGARVSYAQVAGKAYWMNGFEKGVIAPGQASTAWVKPTYQGPLTDRVFSDPPLGHLIGYHNGRMLVAKDNAVFRSEPFVYGRFCLHDGYWLEPERITLLASVFGGVFVGTTRRTVFYPDEGKRRVVSESAPIDGTARTVPGDLFEMPGQNVWLWATADGLCLAGPEGLHSNLTDNRLVYPAASRGAAVLTRHNDYPQYLVLLED